MGENTEPKLEFLEKVENTIEGVVDFIKDFGRTFVYLVRAPRRFGGKLAEDGAKPDFVRPFTFLGICTFVAVRVLKLFVLAFLIFSAAFTKGCSGVTYQEVHNPKLLDLLVLPSWEEIVSIGLPIIFFVLFLSWLFNLALIRNRGAMGSRVAYVACYAIGFQYLIFLILGAPLYGFVFEDWMDQIGASDWAGDTENVFSYYSLGGLLLLVGWTTLVLALLTRSLVRREDWRLRFPGSFVFNLILAPLLFSALTLAGGFGLAYPLASSEYKQQYALKPYLLAAVVNAETNANGHVQRLTVSVVNNTEQSLQFDGRHAEVIVGDSYRAEIVLMKPPAGPVLSLMPAERSWLVLSFPPETNAAPFVRQLEEQVAFLRLKRVATSSGPGKISTELQYEFLKKKPKQK